MDGTVYRASCHLGPAATSTPPIEPKWAVPSHSCCVAGGGTLASHATNNDEAAAFRLNYWAVGPNEGGRSKRRRAFLPAPRFPWPGGAGLRLLKLTVDSGYRKRPWVLHAIPSHVRAPWAVAACAVFVYGCISEATPPVPAPQAHLAITNLTDYVWKIEIRRASGGPAQEVKMAPRSTQNIDLVGADYVIEQVALVEGPAQDLDRRLSVHLDPGETYGWRLVTLLSETGARAGP